MRQIILIFSLAIIFNNGYSQEKCEPDMNNCKTLKFNEGTEDVISLKYCGEVNTRGQYEGCGIKTYDDNKFGIKSEKGNFKNGRLNGYGELVYNTYSASGNWENGILIEGNYTGISQDQTIIYNGEFGPENLEFRGKGKKVSENDFQLITEEGIFKFDKLDEGVKEVKNKKNGIIKKLKLTDGIPEFIFRNDINRRVPEDIVGGKDFIEVDLVQRGSYEDEKIAFDIELEIGGIDYEFLLDSGAMSFTIGKIMFDKWKEAGFDNYTDLKNIEGVTGITGQVINTNTIVIHEIKIGDYIVKNVVARVLLESNSSLLGTGFLLKFKDVIWNMNDKKLVLYK